MKTMLLAAALLFLLAAPALGQTAEETPEQTPRQAEAKNEINEGARAYKAGRFDEARQRFERALELDPEHRNARFFIARAIHAEFKPGADTPENIALARSAIAAYQRALIAEPSNDEAYNAIIYLYGQVRDEAAQREWLTYRATDEQTPAAKRAQAYTLLASREWNCSYAITERKEHKVAVFVRQQSVIKYLKPADEAEFYQARQCAERGMEVAGQAIALDADSLQAWSYKTNLLLELVKLAEMEENDQLKLAYQKQAAEAQRRTGELSEQDKRTREAQERENAEAQERNSGEARPNREPPLPPPPPPRRPPPSQL
jgi:tetratricopeptide (TPR) repeat protein